jgi:hypothetical protein
MAGVQVGACASAGLGAKANATPVSGWSLRGPAIADSRGAGSTFLRPGRTNAASGVEIANGATLGLAASLAGSTIRVANVFFTQGSAARPAKSVEWAGSGDRPHVTGSIEAPIGEPNFSTAAASAGRWRLPASGWPASASNGSKLSSAAEGNSATETVSATARNGSPDG